jgi:3-phosphoshikimate 1-carboxyvinyltransferase
MNHLGVATTYEESGITLHKKDCEMEFDWDFSNCPDLAQTVAVTAALKGITLRMTGIESLRIKETDRIAALQNELGKIGAGLLEMGGGEWVLIPNEHKKLPESCNFETYEDHRMAMAFAPVATLTNVNINDHLVVRKSYPGFWNDLSIAGMDVTIVNP